MQLAVCKQADHTEGVLSCPGCRHGHCARFILPWHSWSWAYPPTPTLAPSRGSWLPLPPVWAASPCDGSYQLASCSPHPCPCPAALHPLATLAAPSHRLLHDAKVGCEGRVSLDPRNLQSKRRGLPYHWENKG